jgi:uncharacterized protein YhbP (UPF0306 family)
MDCLRPFLRAHSTLTLATVSPAGAPIATDLYFVADSSYNVFFLSEPKTRHVENIRRLSRVAATVHAQAWDWREIKGVQLEGVCRELTGKAERAAALARYMRKFGFLRTLSQAGENALLSRAIDRHLLFQIEPDWVRWLDNSETFGFKQEWFLRDGVWVTGRG